MDTGWKYEIPSRKRFYPGTKKSRSALIQPFNMFYYWPKQTLNVYTKTNSWKKIVLPAFDLYFIYECLVRHLVDWNAHDSLFTISYNTLPQNYTSASESTINLSLTVLPPSRNTPSPIDPEALQIPVNYEPDPADLALSSVPGQEVFDPRKCKFSEEELKPQPMIKKARKIFISDDMKVTWVKLFIPQKCMFGHSFHPLTSWATGSC